MDIAGAKALKERLGPQGRDEEPPVTADVPEDAPPVYHYLGVSEGAPRTAPPAAGGGPSFLRRFRWFSR
jgi:hypothetical protein